LDEVPSGLHFKIKYKPDSIYNFKKNCKPDEISSDLHFILKCKSNDTLSSLHLKIKYKSDYTSSDL